MQPRPHDPRLQLNEERVGANTMARRTESRTPLPTFDQPAPSYDGPRPVPLQNVQSMDNLSAPVSRYPQQGISRTPAFPRPASGMEARSLSVVTGYRNTMRDLPQDGRYPGPAHSSLFSRAPPLPVSAPSGIPIGSIPFPSPQPRPQASGTWAGYTSQSPISPAAMFHRPHHERMASSPRLQSPLHESQASSPISQTAEMMPQRPTSAHDTIPPNSARTTAPGSYYRDPRYDPEYNTWRPRSGSLNDPSRQGTPNRLEQRRASDFEVVIDDQESTLLPYASQASPESSWLSISRPDRTDSGDTASLAGTVSSGFSEATLRPSASSDGDGSTETTRGNDLTAQLHAMIEQGTIGANTVAAGLLSRDQRQSNEEEDEEDEDEATLFISAPTKTASPTLMQRPKLQTTLSRPELTVNTASIAARIAHFQEDITPSDSATESESDSGQVRRKKSKSFARSRDQPEHWHVRPEPDQLLERLDDIFPGIDVDKPIADANLSTPTTPAIESPSRSETSMYQPPPLHPSRQQTSTSFASPKTEEHRPPPQHPARITAGWNRSENRKSLRFFARHGSKVLPKLNKDVGTSRDLYAIKQEMNQKKPERRSSLWLHKPVEIKPSKFGTELPSAVPESPLAEGVQRE